MIREKLDVLEKYLARYRIVIGVLVLIMLCVVSIMTYYNFDKQNQIIKTGGFEDGVIKCVCSEEAWAAFQDTQVDVDLSELDSHGLNFTDG